MPVFDIEANGLLEQATKIHCLSYYEDGEVKSLTTKKDILSWLMSQDVLIGHNIIGYDVPLIERLAGVKIKAKLIDTLYLSWYLYPERNLHGLESWGETLGVSKPQVEDWSNLTIEEYVHRCSEDVKINQMLWEKQQDYLSRLYETNDVIPLPIISYLSFKADCAREQEQQKWRLDIDYCKVALEKLEQEKEPKVLALEAAMPPVVKKKLREPPAKPFKKDGTLSVEGAKWQKYLSDQGLTNDHRLPIYVVDRIEPPKATSHVQIKDWLFSLGWEPETFKYEKEDDGSERKIPQVKIPNSPDICPSVLALADDEPAIYELAGLSIIQHRIGILKGFLTNVDDNGYLRARVQGLTNTLRFKHTEIVNLPGIDKPYGEECRGCLIADDDTVLVGTDMVSLEDTTKKHFIYFHDPEYVEEMNDPMFDPHLDLAATAGVIKREQIAQHKRGEIDLGKIRKPYKTVNYGALYGIGPPKLARDLKSTVKFATQLLDVYWKRNWAVRKIAEELTVKIINGQKWLFNPVSKFWYSLRAEKDRFSTLNQGTGVYCFDSWVKECRKLGNNPIAQFHDETITRTNNPTYIQQIQQKAIEIVNDKLRLNVTLRIDSHTGRRYSEIH